MMEILSKMLKNVEGCGLINGFWVGGAGAEAVCISHLLFADDTLLMCDADPEQLMFIWLVLTCFEATTGLRVNFGKRKELSTNLM
jgi:hypothetical protein